MHCSLFDLILVCVYHYKLLFFYKNYLVVQRGDFHTIQILSDFISEEAAIILHSVHSVPYLRLLTSDSCSEGNEQVFKGFY